MKFVSFQANGEGLYGLVDGETVFAADKALRDRFPTLRAAIEADGLAEVAEASRWGGLIYHCDRIDFMPVIPDPGKIICVGLNYRAHGDENGRPDFPALFTRFADTQIGHGQIIRMSPESDRLDYEAELAVIIGRPGRTISKTDSLAHVCGYSCYNDATMRDWQKHSSQFTAGKNFPGTGAFGPFLVTADEIGVPDNLAVTCHVNDEEVQHASTADMLFPVDEIIAYVSRFTPLSAGDVIVTGTPAGVGSSRKPPRFLKPGDVVTVTIDRVGTLRNAVGTADISYGGTSLPQTNQETRS